CVKDFYGSGFDVW
nr:immunoglobulin heavy chain junction region [Macaca mulatta]MOV87286.1 immunoglobulin heavy chain junction region [Macaca mulatta]MOV90951.1 immunoglobulin heavy chain junction region [Macaca mulatta]